MNVVEIVKGMKTLAARFFRGTRGSNTVEYAVATGVIGLGLAYGATQYKDKVNSKLESQGQQITQIGTSGAGTSGAGIGVQTP